MVDKVPVWSAWAWFDRLKTIQPKLDVFEFGRLVQALVDDGIVEELEPGQLFRLTPQGWETHR